MQQFKVIKQKRKNNDCIHKFTINAVLITGSDKTI